MNPNMKYHTAWLYLSLLLHLHNFTFFKFDFSSGGRYDGSMDEHSRKRLQAEVQRMEKISLQHVQELLHRVEEVLGLWRVLIDHQFHTLAATLTQVRYISMHIYVNVTQVLDKKGHVPLSFIVNLCLTLAKSRAM